MNENKRPLAFIALGLLLAALLVPFIIAALGRSDLAGGFGMVAGLLALILGAFSRNKRSGRTVMVAMLLLFIIAGAVGVGLVSIWTSRAVGREERQAQRARMQAEQEAGQRANNESHQRTVDPHR